MDPKQNQNSLEPDATAQSQSTEKNNGTVIHQEIPLPVAMRNDELTEEDFEVLARKARELIQGNGEVLPQPPRKIPMGKRNAAS